MPIARLFRASEIHLHTAENSIGSPIEYADFIRKKEPVKAQEESRTTNFWANSIINIQIGLKLGHHP